jgi:hypothetical protein
MGSSVLPSVPQFPRLQNGEALATLPASAAMGGLNEPGDVMGVCCTYGDDEAIFFLTMTHSVAAQGIERPCTWS